MRHATRLVLVVALLAACGRKGARSSDFDSATAAALGSGAAAAQTATMPKAPHVMSVNAAHQLDRNNMVYGGVASEFKTGDSVLVSVKGIYIKPGADLSARIRSMKATIDSAAAKAGDADTAGYTYVGFRFAPTPKWTKGKYVVEVFLDGKFQMAQDFNYSQP
jgi:hypothetical protein